MANTVGKVIAYVGTMGAGKTKKLVSVYNKLIADGKHVMVFKHANDVERGGHSDKVVARNGDTAPAVAINSLAEILIYETEQVFDAILIDETQFFDDEYTLEILEGAALVGVDVYVFGLDVTSDLKTFGKMGDILARADEVHKLKSRCHKCGAPARVSEFVGGEKTSDVLVGDLDAYQPTCRPCFYGDESPAEVAPEMPVDDEFLEFTLKGVDFGLEMGVYRKDLVKAGYTVEEVKDINSSEGAYNLLRDLGYM